LILFNKSLLNSCRSTFNNMELSSERLPEYKIADPFRYREGPYSIFFPPHSTRAYSDTSHPFTLYTYCHYSHHEEFSYLCLLEALKRQLSVFEAQIPDVGVPKP
jgi:hypothetical protein